MPIDQFILDPMINPFKDMYNQCIAQGLEGKHIDAMKASLDRMEELGQENSDIMTYMGLMTQENLTADFSDHYGKALAAKSKASADDQSGGYNDGALLTQTLDALRQSIKALEDNYQKMLDDTRSYDPTANIDEALEFRRRFMANPDNSMIEHTEVITDAEFEKIKNDAKAEALADYEANPASYNGTNEIETMNPAGIIKPIQALIDLGTQEGMTYPDFLRIQIETGMDKAMEGTAMSKEIYIDDVKGEYVSWTSPYHIKLKEDKLALFEELGAKNKFGCPNHVELSLGNDAIDRKYSNSIAVWEDIIDRWETIISGMQRWAKSYCKNSFMWEEWLSMQGIEQSKINVQTTKDTAPGRIKEQMRLLKKYYGISFIDIFKHETFNWEVKHNRIDDSQEYIEFIIEQIFPHCNPFNHLPQSTIDLMEKIHDPKGAEPLFHLQNPNLMVNLIAYREYYDGKYGQGRYEEKFKPIQPYYSAAKEWDISSFKYAN